MKRLLLVSLAVAVLLASCSIKVDSTDEPKNREVDPTAIGFGVYMKRGVTTKAGYAGELNTDKLKGDAGGFGVFSYYGNGAMYNETMKPDFMYNQQVEFTSNNVWEYSPIKYWPNEFGEAAGNEVADRLSFFAYAPYVAVTPSTGIVTDVNDEDGILGMTRNISAGDPQVMYGARLQPGGGVDLCWGVAANDFTSSVDGNNNNIRKGHPFINLIKPKTGDKISFEFNHALTQLNVQIDADIDVESHATSTLDAQTRIYVRSVTFTGFTTRGSLNLNSEAGNPAWSDISGTGRLRREPVTVYDGRSDGLEGQPTARDINEIPATLSPKIIQSSPFSTQNVDGVTNEPVNMFSYADPSNSVADVKDPIMVIPIVGVPVSVTIVYDIETADPNLAGYLSDGVTHGVSTENKITKTIQMDGRNMTLEAGKRYIIGLHLGLTSVKFDAQVADWDDTQYKGTADLPQNTTSLGDISITDGTGTELSAPTVWSNGTMPTPTIAVHDALGNDITSECTIAWESSNESVATVDNTGAVTIKAPGTTVIKAKVTHGDQTGSKSYTLNVNQVTGITVAAESSNIVIGGSTAVNATLEINGGHGINGTITTMPTVSWESDYDKVAVTASTTAAKVGDNYVATTTATAATDAVADHNAKITAKVGTPYASEEKSADTTLKCLDKVTIASVDLSAASTTVWFKDGASLPTVTVKGTDGQDWTSRVSSLTWTATTDVATYDATSGITLVKSGTAVFEVTATLDDSPTTAASSKTAEYTVYVNEVSGITIAPASTSLVVGMTPAQTATLTATLTYNGGDASPLGTVTSWPTVTWVSGNESCVSIDPSTGTVSESSPTVTTVASLASGAAAGQSSTITATVGSAFVKGSGSVSGTATVNCVDAVKIDAVTMSSSSTTVWKADNTVTTPSITKVTGTDGSDLTSVANVTWSYGDPDVAEVAAQGGAITLKAAGVIKIVATVTIPTSTASPGGDTKDFYFTVNSNEVTGISVDPTSATVTVNGTVTIGTDIAMTQNGDYGTLFTNTPPPVTWNSATPAYVTVTPSATGLSADAKGVATGGSSEVTATVDPAYLQSGATGSASATITCSNATSGTGTGFTWN